MVHVKQVKRLALACRTYSAGSITQFVTHFCETFSLELQIFTARSHSTYIYIWLFSLYLIIFYTIIFDLGLQTRKPDLLTPSEPILVIIVGFVILKNFFTSELFAQNIVPILDSSKSLDDYIHQVALVDCPSLVYFNNDIKALQTGGGFSVLQLLSLTIFRITIFLSGDTRQELDVTISEVSVV